MRVIQFLPNLAGGGVERGTLEIAQALVQAGHDSHVASNGGRLEQELTAQGSQHHHWPLHKKNPMTLLQVGKLRRWLEHMRPDIVHVRSRMPAWAVWLAWRGMNAATRPKFLSTLHGLHSVNSYSAIMTKGERIIAVSNTARRYLLDNYANVSAEKIVVIHRGTDPEAFPRGYQPDTAWLTQWQRDYPQLAGKRVICLPGRLSRLKGHNHLIELIDQLQRAGLDDVFGLIVGGTDGEHGKYVQSLHQQIATRDLTKKIIFTGHRSDIRDIYAISNLVLAVSTKAESFGRTALEPLSLGVPTLGFDIGGVGEILAELYPEGRVPMQDSQALIQRALAVLAQPDQMIKDNHEFLLQQMCAKTLDLYQQMAAS